ncbi:MAG: hypothetical protein SVM86_01400 [Candidatus Cloacimonadota bacterium]|nr:hypothetical protein [Candidatus Cloacimonadota bacterium]
MFGIIYAKNSQIYSYTETTNDTTVLTYYKTTKTDSLIKRINQKGDETQITYYNKKNEALIFSFKDNKSDYKLTKEGNKLLVERYCANKQLQKEYELIPETPWWQTMSYSLTKFSQRTKKEVEYQVFLIGLYDVIKLRAMKKDIEKIEVNSSTFVTQKIEITLCNFGGNFWNANYWFRKSDGLFLKYEGTNNPPCTAKTVIEFVEKVK